MNYYIQGDPSRAQEIKAAFVSKGIDVLDFKFSDILVIYFSIGGCVQVVSYTINLMHILHSHPDYQELELPVEPCFKVGDAIAYTNDEDDVFHIDQVNIAEQFYKAFNDINGTYYRIEFRTQHKYKLVEPQPKFKVGNWIASIDDEGDAAVERIVNLRGNKVLLVDTDGCFTEYPKGELKSYHLWTIADAKDGDILHHSCTASNGTFIFKGVNESGKIFCYCDYDSEDHFCLGEYHHIPHSHDSKFVHPATKEQRDLLFAKIKEAGYQWNADKKELKKIQPHYDIANFHAGMPVLVRDGDGEEWNYLLFSHYRKKLQDHFFAGGNPWFQCIPFEGNKYLLGTTDMPSEEYINW